MLNGCELRYNKIAPISSVRCIISNVQKTYDPDEFAKWLSDAFDESRFKSWQAVADELNKPVRIKGGTRATLSRYAGAKPQNNTDKPSQPNPEFVIALARLFGKDTNTALAIAGHAPIDNIDTFTADIAEDVRVQLLHATNYTEEEKSAYFEAFRVAYAVAKQRIEEIKKSQ